MRTARRTTAIVLGLFAVVSVAYVIVDEATRDPVAAPQVENGAGDRLVAYYFHGDRRCTTCNDIEAFAREAIEDAFPDELGSGRIEWRTLNYEDPANAGYQQRYGLYTSTLVLSDVRDGAERDWVDLDETWQLVGDRRAFVAYVERETRAMLESER